MKGCRKTWQRAALLLAALLLTGPALAAHKGHAYATLVKHATPAFGEWKLDKGNGLVRIQTSGIRMYEHQFGFILKPGHCKEPIGWIAWASTRARPHALQRIRTAQMMIAVAGKSYPAEVPISSILAITPNLTAFALTNFTFNERFLKQIQRAKTFKVRFAGPPALLSLLDVTEDSFSAIGFTKARNYAAAMCAFAGKRK